MTISSDRYEDFMLTDDEFMASAARKRAKLTTWRSKHKHRGVADDDFDYGLVDEEEHFEDEEEPFDCY